MSSPSAHILLFPYPASGHIIPLIDLAGHLLTRGLTVTILVTPARLPLLQPLVSTHPPSSLQPLVLSPPDAHSIPGVSGLVTTVRALRELCNPITQWFKSHPSPPVAIISDFFLGWTHNLATDLGVPRVAFWPSGAFSASIVNFTWQELPRPDDPDNEKLTFSFTKVPGCPKYPWWQISFLYRSFKEGEPIWEFFRDNMVANIESWGYMLNTFYEFEGVYLDYLKKEMGHDRVWAVGPILPSNDGKVGKPNRGGSSAVHTSELMDWLDSKEDDQVVYICFGSHWTLSDKQVSVLASALETSRVHFIWVLKNDDLQFLSTNSFEDHIKGRGTLIKGWAPQVEILRHRAVGAFVTHCGWNSVVEGLSAGVLLLTWPLGADQFNNAKLLVELGVAIRFCDDGNRVVPESTELVQLLIKSVDNSFIEARNKVKEMKTAIQGALEGGSSSRDMDIFVQQLRELGK